MKDIGHGLMKDYTTMKTGGTARIIKVEKINDLQELLNWYHRKLFILGGGSNIIVKDHGIDGVVLKNEIQGITVIDESVKVASGVMMPRLADYSISFGLTGLEFMEGIPGTVGGGVCINAGFISDFSKVVKNVTAIIYKNGIMKRICLSNKECEFAFRKSIFQGMKAYITEVEFQLKKQDPEIIAATIKNYHELRASRQPLEFPSAGSIFKKCKDIKKYYGFRVNQVELVSPGFIINHGGGNSYDIIQIIKKIQKETGAELEVEIV